MAQALSNQFLRSVSLRRDRVSSPGQYPYSIPSLRHLDTLDFHPGVTFFVGENGTGKSTLLEALAVVLGYNAEGGGKNFTFHTRESHSELHQCLRVVRGTSRPRDGYFLRAESYFNLATEVEELGVGDSYGGVSLHEQSHGESFMALFTERFGGNGLYLLDEPEAALSPTRQLSVLALLNELVAKRSQFIIATHSPILLAFPNTWIYVLSSEGIRQTKYEETEHYQVTRDFLNHRQTALEELFRKDSSGQTSFL